VSDRFEPDDPLAARPEPDYVELVDPDPPPPIHELPSTPQRLYGGAPWSGAHSPGVSDPRRWLTVVLAVMFIVPVVVYAVWLFVSLVS
jgi:hypothetical protein